MSAAAESVARKPFGPSPCNTCRRKVRCAAEQFGCNAFVLYSLHEVPERWALAPRQPTRELYERAMAVKPRVFGRRREIVEEEQGVDE